VLGEPVGSLDGTSERVIPAETWIAIESGAPSAAVSAVECVEAYTRASVGLTPGPNQDVVPLLARRGGQEIQEERRRR
jgi:hypothetical protein